MTNHTIAKLRLYHQQIATQAFTTPEQLVRWLGAVQAQDYAGAKWALGLRLQKTSNSAVENAVAEGSIIRIHVLRPTWHFVSPADVRWMLQLTAPRIIAYCASHYRQLKLDGAVFKMSNDAMAKALQGGKQLNRIEMMSVLQQAGVAIDGLRFIHLLMRAELDGVICSGARQGKQFTYAFFDDRVPKSDIFSREEALGELAARYFTSRGPATTRDFTWWSGLTAADAGKGVEIVKHRLSNIQMENEEYWMSKDQPAIAGKAPLAYLLPPFDEFAVAYSNRTAVVNPLYLKKTQYVLGPLMVTDSQAIGTWKRTIGKNGIDIVLNPFGKVNKTQAKAIDTAAERYRRFMN